MFVKKAWLGIMQLNNGFSMKLSGLFLYCIIVLFPVSASAQQNSENKRIVLTQDKDLEQQTLSLENGCILDLRGGTLRNGTIECGDLTIIGNNCVVDDFPLIKCNGNLRITNVVFEGFKRTGVFIEYSAADCKKPIIELNNVRFDGSGKIERVLRSYMNNSIVEATIIINDCLFKNVTEYVVQFASNCTGRITNNEIHDIGNSEKSHVSGVWLGYQDEFLARNMIITNNKIENIQAPYNNIDDGREAHGIIVYGYGNKIKYNYIRNIYSIIDNLQGDPGMDSEGIYVKGDNNEIAYNSLEDATGSGSDGAITVKHIGGISKNNMVHDNVVSIKYSNGIVLYTDRSSIYANKIELKDKSACGIEVFRGKGISILNNTITGYNIAEEKDKFSGAIVVSECNDIKIKQNTILDVPTLLNIIKNDGTLTIEGNTMELTKDCHFGNNTKYTSGVVFQSSGGKTIIKGNRILGMGTKGSQLMEFLGESSTSTIKIVKNEFIFKESQLQNTFLTYLVREAPSGKLVVSNNIINLRGNYISSTKGKSFKRNVMDVSNLRNSNVNIE